MRIGYAVSSTVDAGHWGCGGYSALATTDIRLRIRRPPIPCVR